MTKIKVLECLLAHAEEVNPRSKHFTTSILKRHCRESCDNSTFCNRLLSACNYNPQILPTTDLGIAKSLKKAIGNRTLHISKD